MNNYLYHINCVITFSVYGVQNVYLFASTE